MSEPTNAEMAEQEDLRLDAQIAELMEARAATGNLPPEDWTPERDAPPVLVEAEDRDWLETPTIFDVIAKHLGGSK